MISTATTHAMTIPAIAPAERPEEDPEEATTATLAVVTPETEVTETPVNPCATTPVLNWLAKPELEVDAKNVAILVATASTAALSEEWEFTWEVTVTPALRVADRTDTSSATMVYENCVVAQLATVSAKTP